MAGKKPWHRKRTLVYPKHAFRPEELLGFLELTPFQEGWNELELDDDDLESLQVLIMLRPKGHPVVPGTGGLRKLRFAPATWRTGKRGAVRVGYVYLEARRVVLLVIAYSKDEKDDLAPAERKAIKALIARVEKEFESGIIR